MWGGLIVKKGILKFWVLLIRYSPLCFRGKIAKLTYSIIKWMYPANSCGVFFNEINKRGIFGHLDEIADIIDSNPEIKRKNSRYNFDIGWKRRRKR